MDGDIMFCAMRLFKTLPKIPYYSVTRFMNEKSQRS